MPTLKDQLHNSATHAKGYDPACPKCTEVVYIAIGPNVWGKGDTPQAAFRAMQRANNGHSPKNCTVYSTQGQATVDEVSGGISYAKGAPAPEAVYTKRNGRTVGEPLTAKR